jgi:hypothetical protein
MRRIIAIILLAAGLGGCDMISLLMDGLKNTAAVEDDLERATGVKPKVGFNWKNGSLELVTVTFPRVYDSKPLSGLAEEVRAAVKKEFKQKPDDIVLGFSLSAPAGQTAQAD